jgi:mono/diheme cytochrome c family protein
MRAPKLFVLVALFISLLALSVWTGMRLAPESAPVARGAAYAQTRGCISCHGDPANPIADANDRSCSNTNEIAEHPDFAAECTDLLAFFEAVRLRRLYSAQTHTTSDNPLAAGEHLARQYHCFQCHGQLGQGGFKNADSLKGYVPGYFGADFRILTNNSDPASVREWILNGMNNALVEEPLTGRIAQFFFSRQAVHMPRYNSLRAEEVDALVNYVLALQDIGPMTAQDIREYGNQTQAYRNLKNQQEKRQ